jgi:hypothetical protein
MIASIPDFATPLDPERAWMLGAHGPTCVPYVPWGWSIERDGPPPAGSSPHSPGTFARYLVIDLDENNRHSRAEWAKRNGREPQSFGWGICRAGFGLQNLPTMTREEAERVAIELNAAIRIGKSVL